MKLIILIALIACAYSLADGLITYNQVLVNMTCLKQNNTWMLFRVSDANGNIDYTSITNIKNANDAGVHNVDLVIQACKGCTGETQITKLIDAIKGFGMTFKPYVWVQPDEFYDDIGKNRDLIRLITELFELHSDYFHDYGIVSDRDVWNKLFGQDFQAFGDKDLIWINADNNPDVYAGWVKFGGWISPINKLYATGNRCNNNGLFLLKWGAEPRKICANSKVFCQMTQKCCQAGATKAPQTICCASASTCCSISSTPSVKIMWCCPKDAPKCGTTKFSCKLK